MMSIGCQAPGYVTTEAPRSLSMPVMDPRSGTDVRPLLAAAAAS